MNKIEVIAFSAAFAIVAMKLYQKYYKKDQNKGSGNNQKQGGNLLSSGHGDDDYEPYSKK